jgi:hypothetical protein
MVVTIEGRRGSVKGKGTPHSGKEEDIPGDREDPLLPALLTIIDLLTRAPLQTEMSFSGFPHIVALSIEYPESMAGTLT